MLRLLPDRARTDDDSTSSPNPTLLDSLKVVVGPAKNCVRCGASVRDADVTDLKKIVKVLGQPQPLITSEGEVVVGYVLHDSFLCEQVARGGQVAS